MFPCGRLSLEGIIEFPEGRGPSPAVIVCHPHPRYGGSMENSVVNSLCEALTQASFVSFKFNFRGTGKSQGEFSLGIGEQEDVDAAISFISEVTGVDAGRIGIVGYSAGAGFSFPVGVRDERIKALAAVSPPLSMFDFESLKDCPKPKLLISGAKDDIVDASRFLQFCRDLPEPKECVSIEGADHFWGGYEPHLTGRVVGFFTEALTVNQGNS